MGTPISKLTKKELLWLGTHRCSHSHTYLEHYECYLKEGPRLPERIGFLDIETSNLNANFGVILCWSIKPLGKRVISDVLSPRDFRNGKEFYIDKRIVKTLIQEMSNYDRLVTHYGSKFDIPMIRTRALICGVEFPPYGSIIHNDTYYMAKGRLKLNSYRLDVVAQSLFGKSDKTHLSGNIWVAAGRGNRKALKYILEHNKIDVMELEKIWMKLKDFVVMRNTSI